MPVITWQIGQNEGDVLQNFGKNEGHSCSIAAGGFFIWGQNEGLEGHKFRVLGNGRGRRR